MRVSTIVVLILVFIVFVSAKPFQHGAGSIPELSTKIYEALKTGSHKKLERTFPSYPEIEKAFETYLQDTRKSKEENHKEAANEYEGYRINLNNEFDKVLEQAKGKKIDWKSEKLLDFKYVQRDHSEGYKDAKVRMILENDKQDKEVIIYNAYLFGDRWFLIQDLGWE
jgi:hypothetical protein